MGKKEPVTIEGMRREDIDQVLAIETASFSMPWSRNLFLSEFRSPGVSHLLVALSAGASVRIVTGYIIFWVIQDEMHILNLAIGPQHRRHGIARTLATEAVKRAGRKGARRAFLEVRASNLVAQKLYSRLGFVGSSLRRDYYDQPVEDAVLMTLERGAFARLANEGWRI